ncbi:hypothetical protein I4U23_010084 [Adineta vaga]|nr:hypothetical protein I4U23_010084 [Adineta vaga]
MCSFVTVYRLLNYIPNVQSLTVRIYTDFQNFSKQISIKQFPTIHSSIRHLKISTINNIPFHQIEEFFTNQFIHLDTLKFFFKTDAQSQSSLDYIDDQRWQSLLQSFVSLEHFHCSIELPIQSQIYTNTFITNEFFLKRNWLFTSQIYTYSFNTILRLHTKPYLKQRLDIVPSKAFVVNNNIYSCVRDLRILIDTIPNDLPKNLSQFLYPNVTSLTLISNKSFHEQSFLLYLYSIIDHKHLRYLTVQLDDCSRFFLLSLIERYTQLYSITLSTYHSWSKIISLSSQVIKNNLCSLTVYEIFHDFDRYHPIHQLVHRLEILSVSVSSTEDCYRFLTLLFIGSQKKTVEQLRSLTIKCDFDEPDIIANWIRSNILRKLSYKCTPSILFMWF